MNVSWDFFSRRRKIDLRDFVSKFSSYKEVCEWCEAKGVEPPEESSVKVILNPSKPKPKPKPRTTRKPRAAKPKAATKTVTKTESKTVTPVEKTEVVKVLEEKESDA
jgi:hypothetical protein